MLITLCGEKQDEEMRLSKDNFAAVKCNLFFFFVLADIRLHRTLAALKKKTVLSSRHEPIRQRSLP